MSVLKNIQSLCNRNNTSVPKLELELGFSRGSVYNWDKSSPSIDKLEKVADYFKVSTDFLLGKKEDQDDLEETMRFMIERKRRAKKGEKA